tara:strand:+ start:389 stop:2014 length:1626 start_codon:yes stop_codon:yes gene_type:complete
MYKDNKLLDLSKNISEKTEKINSLLLNSLLRKYQKASNQKENYKDLFEECYELAFPQRKGFYDSTVGERRDEKIFDETCVVGVQEFASRLQQGLVPNFARWADFQAGSETPSTQKEKINNQLDEVTDYVFEIIQQSNFAQEIHESFMDLAVGTAVLGVEEGNAINPINFSAIPLTDVVLDTGPDDRIDHVFREREMRYSDIKIVFPNGFYNEELEQQILENPDSKTRILEIVCKDYTKNNEDAYYKAIIHEPSECFIDYKEFSGLGSNPFVCFRWSKCAGEVYGRGPLMNALSAIKTCNLTIQLILENAQMAISGIYQMDDDGVVNPDTISLMPGTIIPKSPTSAGLQPINAAGRFDVAQLILSDMRMNIKRALYNDMLGNPDRTPASATEVAERMADLSRRIGSAFGRLQAEMVQPVLQRIIYILKKQGRIEVPSVNGREVKIRSVSPLAQAQNQADITAVARWLELIQSVFGEKLVNILIDTEQVAAQLARKFGVPDNMVRDEEDRKKLVEIMNAQMQQQAQMQGQQPPIPLNPENTPA